MSEKKVFRVIIGDFHQETNSFNPNVSHRDYFERGTCAVGQAVIDDYRGGKARSLSGIMDVAEAHGAEIIPACAMFSSSGGTTDQAVVDEFLAALLDCCRAHPEADAVLLALHGATAATGTDDACGDILSAVRQVVGHETVVAAACDMHAKVTDQFTENADIVCGFQTYPHVDQYLTGRRAAELAFEMLETGKKFYTARICLPMIVPACGYNTNEGSLHRLHAAARQMLADGRLKDYTVFQMQPWLDAAPAGSTVLAIGEDAATAKECCAQLAADNWTHRDEYWPKLYSVAEITEAAKSAPAGKPVVLVDFADSTGGGAPGTSAEVLWYLSTHGWPVSAAMIVRDPAALEQAMALGQGAVGDFTLGDAPLPTMHKAQVRAQVLRVYENGYFIQKGPVATGQRRNLGKAAVLRTENADVLVTVAPASGSDPNGFRAFGIEPTDYQLVVVKANTSFRANYDSFIHAAYLSDTPGVGSADLCAMPFTHIPRPFYPFDHMDDYQLPAPTLYAGHGKI